MVSQEQLDQVKQQEPVAEDDVVVPSVEEEIVEEPVSSPISDATESSKPAGKDGLAATATVTKKKRVKKKVEPVDEKAMSPRPSYWPLILAFSLAVVLAGAVSNLIILGVGVLLVIISIIGWVSERR